jgi:hypothetical protein
MKKLFLLSFLLVAIHLWAQYSTPGNNGSYTLNDLVAISDGAISMEDDQYFFNEDIVISTTDTLKIFENVVIEIGEELLWTIEGVLILDAPDLCMIRKKTMESNFEGIRFDNSSASVLRNAWISYGGGVKLVESDMIIQACTFDEFNTAYSTGSVDLYQSNPLIRDCTFSNNKGPAIASGANSTSSPQIINNVLNYNVTGNANTPQINLGTSDGLNPIIIDSNHIYGMYDMAGGIALSTLYGGSIIAYVRNNEVSFNRYGIAMIGSDISGEISYNHIEGNNIQNDPMLGGSGLNFYGGSTNNMIVHHNTILDNLWGVTIQLTAQPNLGDGTDNSPGRNQLYNNGNSGETYALCNNTPDDIWAMNNFWGTATLEQTEEVIFHEIDDPTLGEVFFDPIWIPVGIEEVQPQLISFYPNPAQDYFIWKGDNAKILISNINGKVVWEGQVEEGDKVDFYLKAGIYIIQFGNQFHKLMVQ